MDAMTPPAMMAGQPQMPKVTHDVKIKSTRKLARAKVLGIPPEEFGIERGARSIPDSNYCFHDVVTKTQADLIDEGYDADQIEALTDYTGRTDVETMARDTVQEHYNSGAGQINKASRRVKITEHYLRIDYEGTGRPCLYQIVTGGDRGEILRKKGKPAVIQFDRMPFAGATPVPVAHRFFGRSIADQVMDIQRIKTAILRGVLDNSYMVTNPRTEVPQSHSTENTIDDLLVSRPNGIVRTKTPGGLLPLQTPSIGQYLLPVMDYMDSVREMRTGVTKQGQGVDADALQNQSATAVQHVFNASQARQKLIIRSLAEGLKDLFLLLHATIRKHGQQKMTIRLRNNWVTVDPRNWKTRNDMTINVGLGDGGKAEQIGRLTLIANVQEKLVAGGKVNIVDDEKIWNLASEMTKLTGYKNPDRFFNDVTQKDPQTGQPKYPAPPTPPDSKVMAIQAQAQNDQQELAMKAQLDKQKAEDAAALAKFKAEIDAKLKVLEAHVKMVEAERKARSDQQAHHAKMIETVVDVAAAHDKHQMSLEHGQQQHEAKLEQMKQKPKGPE